MIGLGIIFFFDSPHGAYVASVTDFIINNKWLCRLLYMHLRLSISGYRCGTKGEYGIRA